jgi:WD40 repeat protein
MIAVPVPAPGAGLGGPWLGLQSYEEQHRPLFFGRDAEQDELFRLIERGVLTVLYGVSGLGKTSLLNAGLFPRLREAFYLPIPVHLRFGDEAPEPIVQIREAVMREIAARCSADTPPPSQQQTLWEFFHRTPLWNHAVRLLTPVLAFDQFEEVLTLGARDARTPGLFEALADLVENYIPRSVAELVEASEQGLPFSYEKPKIKVIFCLREDYLAQLQELRPFMPSLMRNSYRLKPMKISQALEAVIKPARQAGLGITEEAAERIVHIASGAEAAATPLDLDALPEVEPVLLSLFCDELNKKRVRLGLPSISKDLAQGERSRILSDFYNRCIANEVPEVRRYIEDDLLTKEGHRDTKAVENLPEAVQQAVGRLIDLRLLRREERLGRPYVELIHDVLAEPISRSRNERREQDAVEQERRRQEEARSRERARLEQERERLKRDNDQRELQRQRDKVWVFEVAAAICLVLALFAAWQWYEATNARMEELASRLAAEANALATRPDGVVNGALLATESLKIRLTPETSSSWAEAIDRFPLNEMRHEAPVTVVAFSPDGRRLATASADKRAQVWDLKSASKPTMFFPHQSWLTVMAFSPDGTRLATASGDSAVQMWDLESPTRPATSLPHQTRVTSMAFSPDGRYLTTAGADNKARVWDLLSDKPPIPNESRVPETGMIFSPDGKRAASSGSDNVVRVWDVESGKEPIPLRHPAVVTAMVFSADGQRLATATDSTDKKVRVWDLESGKEPIQIEYGVPLVVMAFSADGKRLATAHRDGRLRIWDAERGIPLMAWESPAEVTAIAFSPDGKRLATGHPDNMARVWALESAAALIRLASQARVTTIAFSPDGQHLIATHRDNTAREWDLTSGKEVKVTRLAREGLVTAVALSADTRRAATASIDNIARVWDLESGKELIPLPHQKSVTAMAFSPDGKRLATAGADAKARVWDLESGTERLPLPHKAELTAVAFSANGKRLATGSADGIARVWDIEDGKEIVALPHRQPVTTVAFSADGKRLATASVDNTARVWDLESTKEPRELVRLPHRAPISAVAFSPVGEHLASVDANNIVRLWPLTALDMIRVACARLPRNLSPQDRRWYLRDEHHPVTCPNLPED